jgi:hypothetical protein
MPSLDRESAPDLEPTNEDRVPEELQGEQIVDLPTREALSIVDPGAFGIGIPMPLARPVGPPPTTGATPSAPATGT